VEQQQVLARQLAFLLCVPPRGGTQFGILRSEPRHGGGEIGGYARQSCGYYDLVEDAAVRRVEWVSAASRLPRDYGHTRYGPPKRAKPIGCKQQFSHARLRSMVLTTSKSRPDWQAFYDRKDIRSAIPNSRSL
jgi:hypothetical protein